MTIQGDSLRAIQGAENSLNLHARNIANADTPGYRTADSKPRAAVEATSIVPAVPSGSATPDSNNVDLATEMVGLQEDRRTAGYNLKSLKVQDRMTGDLLDLVA